MNKQEEFEALSEEVAREKLKADAGQSKQLLWSAIVIGSALVISAFIIITK